MKWLRAGALTTSLLVMLAAAAWFLWVPEWRPPLADSERYGVDVSHHQGAIDWRAVAGDGIAFAYIKATEGGDFTDDDFAENWKQARDVGIQTGAYHYFTLCTDGEDQARHFLRIAAPDPAALPPAVDLEFSGNCSARPAQASFHDEVDEFIRIVERAWDRPLVLYVFHDFEQVYQVRQTYDRPLWIPSFPQRPRGDWAIWQLHGFARVDGVEGRVDLDVARIPALYEP